MLERLMAPSVALTLCFTMCLAAACMPGMPAIPRRREEAR